MRILDTVKIHLLVFLVVNVFVFSHPLEVIEGFLSDTNGEHEDQRRYVGKHEADFQDWDELS